MKARFILFPLAHAVFGAFIGDILNPSVARAQVTAAVPHIFSTPDEDVTFFSEVPLARPITSEDGFFSVAFGAAPDGVTECKIFRNEINVGALLRINGRNMNLDPLGVVLGKKYRRLVDHIDAGVAGSSPYLYASWIYGLTSGENGKLGRSQQYAANREGHGITCSTSGFGYSMPPSKAALGLIESLHDKKWRKDPYFRQIDLISLPGMTIGYTLVEMLHEGNRKIQITTDTETIIHAGADDLKANKAVLIDWVSIDGAVRKSMRFSALNDEKELDVYLTPEPTGGKGWLVMGTYKGKTIEQAIPLGSPSSLVSETNHLRRMLSKANPIGAQVNLRVWLSRDPSRFANYTLKITSAINENTYSVREMMDGEIYADLEVDRATGQATQAVRNIGAVTITSSRIYVHGTP